MEVSGESSLVNTASGQVATTIQMSHVLEMPLVSRNVFSLTNLATASRNDGGGLFLGGGHTRGVVALYDGINDTRGDSGLGNASTELTPPVDSVQEFTVAVVAMSAEYGRTSSGVVTAVTKSGTNRFHGNFYEFLRNDDFDALGWGNDSKPALRQNNFGATIGGPIRRNRTFFFYNYDGQREHNSNTVPPTSACPSSGPAISPKPRAMPGAAPRLVVIYDPETGSGDFGTPSIPPRFPATSFPSNRLDPVASRASSMFLIPIVPPTIPSAWPETGSRTCVICYPGLLHTGAWIMSGPIAPARSGATSGPAPTATYTGYTRRVTAPPIPTASTRQPHRNAAVNTTHLFSPTLFLNFTSGSIGSGCTTTGDCCATNYGQTLGIPNVPGRLSRASISPAAWPHYHLGAAPTPTAWIFRRTPTSIDRQLHQVQGVHTLKYGVQSTRFNGNKQTATSPAASGPSTGQYTRASGGWRRHRQYRYAPGRFRPRPRISRADRQSKPTDSASSTSPDTSRTTGGSAPRLTLNLGIRYDVETPIRKSPAAWAISIHTRPIRWRAPAISRRERRRHRLSGSQRERKYLMEWDKKNFAPRFGFAWRVFGNADTVVRGGFGVFYWRSVRYLRDPVLQHGIRRKLHRQYAGSLPPARRHPRDRTQPRSASALTPTFGDRNTPFATSTIDFIQPDRTTPYSENFNLTIQHQWKGVLFEAGYLGHLGRHPSFGNTNINLIPPQLLSQTSVNQRLRRPWSIRRAIRRRSCWSRRTGDLELQRSHAEIGASLRQRLRLDRVLYVHPLDR